MNVYTNDNKALYYRLIALWVVCEAFAGGIMHAAKIPFTGMIVSSLAVTCIIFIAYYVPDKTAVIKATVTVAVFKLMLSPHSPPTAYIAVFFQGFLGHLLFNGRKHFAISAVALSVLALVESALQRILVLLIIYGNSFWNTMDKYVQKIAGGSDRNYSELIALGYIIIHAVAGLIIGIFAASLVKRSENRQSSLPALLIADRVEQTDLGSVRKKKKNNLPFLVIWVLLIVLFLQAILYPENAVLPKSDAALIFLRSVLILLTWYLILGPLLMKLIKKRLESEKLKQKLPLKEIMDVLPGVKYIFRQSWSMSGSEHGLKRLKFFFKILQVNILFRQDDILQKEGMKENG